jgi:hypothetical protein
LLKQAETDVGEIRDLLAQNRQEQLASIGQATEQARARALQGLRSRGLAATTLLGDVERGVAADFARRQAEVRDAQVRDLLSILPQLLSRRTDLMAQQNLTPYQLATLLQQYGEVGAGLPLDYSTRVIAPGLPNI